MYRTWYVGFDHNRNKGKLRYRIFQVLDVNGDGFITVDELRHALTKTGDHFTEAEIADIIRRADRNNDGKIDYNGEFYQFCLILFNC